MATEAFPFVISVVTSGSTMCQNVSVRRTRDEVSSAYKYPTVGPDENETEAMLAMFQHEHFFTTEDLRTVKTNLKNGKDIDLALLRKQLYIGTMAFCRGYVSMLECKGSLTNDQKAKLKGIHMAICSSECDKISSLPVFYVDEKFTHQVIYFNTKSYIFLCQVEYLYIKFITLQSVANIF